MRVLFALVALLALVSVSFSVNVASCQVINAPGVYTLIQDIVGGTPQAFGSFDPTCLGINASNAVLNCAGHKIDSGNSSLGTAIIAADSEATANLSGIVIANCTVTGNYSGSGSSAGIMVQNVVNGSVKGNTVLDITSGADGFRLSGYNAGTIVTNNTAGNLIGTAFNMDAPDFGNNTLTRNTAFGADVGFEVDSIGNRLSNNTAYGNSMQGFHVWNVNNTLSDNVAHDNGFSQSGFYAGFVVECCGAENNLLQRNAAYNNTGSGFYQYYSQTTLYANNTAYANSENGFQIDGDPATLVRNDAHGNANNGFLLRDGEGNNLSGNKAFLNGENGFYADSDDSNGISNNTAYLNNGSGFYLFQASFNALDNNTAHDNLGSGFYVDGGGDSSNNFTKNLAYKNGEDGFHLFFEDLNIFRNNTATMNNQSGFALDDSFDNAFINNSAVSNRVWAFSSSDGSTGNLVSNFSMGNVKVSFESKDINIKNTSPQITSASGGSPSVEVVVSASANDGSTQSTGISDGSTGDRDITSFGPSAADFTGARAYLFSAGGDAAEAPSSGVITTLSSPTIVPGASANGTLGDDEVSVPISLPFNVTMYGRHNDQILVSSNGFIYLNSGAPSSTDSGCCSGESMSSQTVTSGTDFLVAGVWNDMYPPSSPTFPSTVTYGTEGVAPNRVFIVSYDNISNCCDSSGGYTFQIKLFENYTPATITHSPLADPPGKRNIGKFVEATANSVDSFLFLNVSYIQGDVSAVNESSLAIMKNSVGNWTTDTSLFADPFGVNTTSNVVFANISVFGSIFAPMGDILNVTTTVPGGDQSNPSLSVRLSANCSGNVVSVTSGGPVEGAEVLVDGNSIGTTDQNGQVSFQGCGSSVIIRAKKNGYQDGVATVSEVACGQCAPPKCTTDADCASDQKCQTNENPALNQCVLVSCSCGQTASDHQCTGAVWQCGPNCGSCPQGESCTADHICKPTGCTSDLQCQDDEICRTSSGAPGTNDNPGSCKPLCADGSNSCQCSVAQNHSLVPLGYECGTEAGCSSCPSGQSCVDHKCIQNDINCPTSVVVGANATCLLTENNQACGPNDNCTTVVTTPDGKNVTLSPDENGNVVVPGSISGRVKVQLLKNGAVVKEVFIDVVPKSQPGEQPPPSSQGGGDIFSLLWLLLLLLIVIGAVIYWRSRGQKK